MDEERPSVTAEGAAVMRTIHQTLGGEPKILVDPISPRLIDTQSDFYRSRLTFLERLPELTRMRLKATFVMRSRYAEDCLAELVQKGVGQYVLLGAGLDTFAYRQRPGRNRFRSLRSIIQRLNDGSAGNSLTRIFRYRAMSLWFR